MRLSKNYWSWLIGKVERKTGFEPAASTLAIPKETFPLKLIIKLQ